MNADAIADSLNALGNPVRLSLFRLLVRAGEAGLTFGQIQAELGIPASTLSHHVGWLARAGLVDQERRGREVISRADYAAIRGVIDFLMAECCTGVGGAGAPPGRPPD